MGGTSTNSRKVRVFPQDGVGGDGNGRESDQAVMRLPEGNGNVSCGTSTVGGDASCHGAGMPLQQQLDAVSTSATLCKAATQLLEGSVDSANAGMLGVGDENSVLLPGPEGGVEVRECEGGVLLVRRSEDAKKRSPERLNLHRRRLASCPIIQVVYMLVPLDYFWALNS